MPAAGATPVHTLKSYRIEKRFIWAFRWYVTPMLQPASNGGEESLHAQLSESRAILTVSSPLLAELAERQQRPTPLLLLLLACLLA